MDKSRFFTSKREQRLWMWASLILAMITSTLVFGGQLLELNVDKRVIEQSTFNLFLLLVLSLIISGWKIQENRLQLWIYAGVFAVIGMAILRSDLSVAERSHMFEYGLLSLLTYQALSERRINGSKIKYPALFAFLVVGFVGLIDECIQIFIPYRVFDPIDIGFNFFASAFGILISLGVYWIQNLIIKYSTKK